ncbi:hypothetical protein K504DRAFT_2096 [Pleomassaria siparia CBS 279.74]|uniref:Uncharacterized protein n=1 Tax=Pleomassaria siparia CBS 279.74 TaxID=1314801 RepID=A0A6G1KNA0_9PLEO|nr:hypothetical protein K504DRAFT_2096 [Pleomassaria siparia CBS 279.74]
MSRRYPTAELYEERQRDFYRDGNRSERSYDELDIELNRSHADPRRSAPNFLREDYGGNRSSAGPLVVRERVQEEEIVRGPARRREVEQDALVIRSRPPPPASSVREVEREEINIRRGDNEHRRPREVNRDETDITIRHREQSRPRPPPSEVREREVEREEISFRRGGGPPRPREVDIEREEVRFREREPPRREVERDEITFRHEHREESRHGRERDVEKDSITIRNRERSLPAPRSSRGELVAREREEIIVRRREPSPPPREVIKDQIIIRRRERSPSPAPLPPPPPPPPEPEIRPPIIQEIITHHRHIDHGMSLCTGNGPPC